MKLLTPNQSKELVTLIQEVNMVDFFTKVLAFGVKTYEIKIFEKEFIFGIFRYDYYNRLQIYINSISEVEQMLQSKSSLQVLESFKLKRLQTLENHINKAFTLLQACEEQKDLATTPTERARMDLEIAKIKTTLADYEKQYKELYTN